VKNFAIVGTHIYGAKLVNYALAKQKGKEVWMTEHFNDGNTWASCMLTAKEINDAMTVAEFNAYVYW
jgi:glucuronoarabinoxylan endo-1,4-beta-xylanase